MSEGKKMPTPEQKEKVFALVAELQGIIRDIPTFKTFVEKRDAALRLGEIREKLIAFRREYPDV